MLVGMLPLRLQHLPPVMWCKRTMGPLLEAARVHHDGLQARRVEAPRDAAARLVHVADAAHGVSIPCPGTQRAFFDRRCRRNDARAPAIRVKRARRLRVGK
eukprot:scaffold43345_cov45-Phaeocystis_antarctica.AAC.2